MAPNPCMRSSLDWVNSGNRCFPCRLQQDQLSIANTQIRLGIYRQNGHSVRCDCKSSYHPTCYYKVIICGTTVCKTTAVLRSTRSVAISTPYRVLLTNALIRLHAVPWPGRMDRNMDPGPKPAGSRGQKALPAKPTWVLEVSGQAWPSACSINSISTSID